MVMTVRVIKEFKQWQSGMETHRLHLLGMFTDVLLHPHHIIPAVELISFILFYTFGTEPILLVGSLSHYCHRRNPLDNHL